MHHLMESATERQTGITKSQRTAAFILTLFFFVLLVILGAQLDDNKFDFTLKGRDFSVNGGTPFTIDKDYGTLVMEPTQTDGVAVNTDNLVLEPGTYTYDFQYALADGSANWSIFSSDYLSDDNQSGKVWWNQPLSPDASSVTGSFDLDHPVTNFGIRIDLAKGAAFSIGRLTLRSNNVSNHDAAVFMLLGACGYVFLLWMIFTRKTICKPAYFRGEFVTGRRMSFLLLLAMSITAFYVSTPLFSQDLSAGYDLLYHVNRIEGIAKSLACGQFPVRIHSGLLNGYGYANSIFYPELLLYFPAGLRLLGLSLMNCYKVLAVTASFATVAVAYGAFSKLLSSRTAGLMAAVLYTLNPYRLACIYERSAVGEYLAMIFLPAVFYGFYAVFFGEKKDWKWLCLGAAGVLQCHILTTEIVAFFCAFAGLIFIRRLFQADRRWLSLLKAAVWAVALNLWFLIPFVLMSLQLNIAVFSRNPQLSINAISSVHELFTMTYLRQLRENGGGVANNGLGFVFLAALALFVLYLILFRPDKKEGSPTRRLLELGTHCSLVAAFTVFAATDLFPWEEIQSVYFVSKIVGSLQFPFRLFSVTMVCLAILSGIALLLWTATPLQRRVAATAAILIAAFSATLYLDYTISYAPVPHFASQHQLKIETSTIRCIALGEYIPANSNPAEILGRGTNLTPSDSSIKITDVHRNGTSISFDFAIDNQQPQQEYYVLAPLTYYPSFRAVINGTEYDTRPGGTNYVRVDLPEQSGHVEVSYRQPRLFVAATGASAAACVLFLLPLAFPKLKNRFIY